MPQEPPLSARPIPRISYAPNHEDILLDRIFTDHVGTFMDVGAGGPTVDNMTYFFYRRGWRGVNIEPNPRHFAQLQSVRPGDLNLPLAAWDSNGEIPFTDPALVDGDRSHAMQGRQVTVRAIRSLVEELELDPPDFLVIDAGGSEEHAIRGIPLERWRPGVIVASTVGRGDAHKSWEPILLAHGYLFAAFNGVNRFYLRDDLRHHRTQLDLPVSVLDRFRNADVAALEERLLEIEQQAIRWRIDASDWRDRCTRLESESVRDLRERIDQAHEYAELEGRLIHSEQGRAHWQRECEALRNDLVSTQRHLRPYRLIDQLGVVTMGYRLARRLKPNRAS